MARHKKKEYMVDEVAEQPQEEVVETPSEETPVEETSVHGSEVPTEEVKEEEAPVEAPKAACPDCTVLVADGGKSEFTGSGGVKPGLINPNTHCPTCEGHGVVEAKEE